MKKQTILIDVDDVICHDGFLVLVNEFLNTNYNYDDVKDYYIQDLVAEDRKQEWWDFFLKKNNYNYAEILPNAYDILSKLNEQYEIYICTASVNPFLIEESGIFFKNKYDWLIKNFPFLNPNNFIFTNVKNVICADIQIDDKLSNLLGNAKHKFLFEAYHNKEIRDDDLKLHGVIRVKNWKEIEDILLN